MRQKCNRDCELIKTGKYSKQECIYFKKRGLCKKVTDPMKIERIEKRLRGYET